MSQNQVDLVFYAEVEGITRDELGDLAEDLELTWEYESSRCVLSETLASVDFDAFQIEETAPIVSHAQILRDFLSVLEPHGTTIKRSLYAMVPWYNGADRPVPKSLR